MTTRPQENPRPYRNGSPELSRILRRAAMTAAVPAAVSAVLASGFNSPSTARISTTFTLIALAIGAVAALLFFGMWRTAPVPTRAEEIQQIRDTIGELQALLARLLRDDNADQGVITEVRALTAGLTVNPHDPMALGQARRRLALSAVEGSGAGPLAIAAAPATARGGNR